MLYAKPGAGRGVAPKLCARGWPGSGVQAPAPPAGAAFTPGAQRPERPSRPVPSGGILDTTTYMLVILTRGSGL